MPGNEVTSAALISFSAVHHMMGRPNQPDAPPSFILGLEESIKPGRMSDYREATHIWIEQLRAMKVKTAFNAFSEGPDTVVYLEPVAGEKEFREKQAVMASAAVFVESDWGRRRLASINWSKYTIWQRLADLCYRPVRPAASPAAMPYFIWWNIRPAQANVLQFFDIASAFKKMLEQHDVDHGYGVFHNIVGEAGPLFSVVLPFANPQEYNSWRELMEKELESEIELFCTRFHAIVRETTAADGWFLPDLSLLPETR